MDCNTSLPTAANFTVPVILPKPKPADLVADVLEKLRTTRDPDEAASLLSLGIDVLRRRQAERGRERA